MKFEKLEKFQKATLKGSERIIGGSCTDVETEHIRYNSSHEAVDGMGIGTSAPAGDDQAHLYGDYEND